MKKVIDGTHAKMIKHNTMHVNFKDINFKDMKIDKEHDKFIVSDLIIYMLCNSYIYLEKPLFYTSIHQLDSTIDGNTRTKAKSDTILFYLKDYENII
jgi:hypothetical protein